MSFGYQVHQFGIDTNTLPIVKNLLLWIDAADTNTIIADSSNNVSQWDDKSGNNHNFTQGTGSNQPLFIEKQVNGHGTVRFNGTSDFMTTPSVLITGTTARTFIMVVRGELSGTGQIFNMNDDLTAGTRYVITSQVRTAVVGGNKTFNESVQNATSYFVLTLQNPTGGNIANTLGRLNGIIMTLSSSTSQAINTGTSGDTRLGASPAAVNHYPGDICELVAYNRELSLSELQSIEFYLGVKWGISV